MACNTVTVLLFSRDMSLVAACRAEQLPQERRARDTAARAATLHGDRLTMFAEVVDIKKRSREVMFLCVTEFDELVGGRPSVDVQDDVLRWAVPLAMAWASEDLEMVTAIRRVKLS